MGCAHVFLQMYPIRRQDAHIPAQDLLLLVALAMVSHLRPPVVTRAASSSQAHSMASAQSTVMETMRTTDMREMMAAAVSQATPTTQEDAVGQPHRTSVPHGHMALGFYGDGHGEFAAFTLQRERLLGPLQAHLLAAGLPGAGKTNYALMLLIALFASARRERVRSLGKAARTDDAHQAVPDTVTDTGAQQ